MIGTMTPPEAIGVLCLLMVGADEEIKLEELTSMLNNPFFAEHVAEKIGDHQVFLQQFNDAQKTLGKDKLEAQATKVLKSSFPALQTKTLALLSLIADSDGDFDQREKVLVARIATNIGFTATDVEPELQKMRGAIRTQGEEVATKTEPPDKKSQAQ